MLTVVKNGILTKAEQDMYVRLVTSKYPPGVVEIIILNVQGDFVDIQYELHRYR